MEVKGVSLISTREFVSVKFTSEDYNRWIKSLSLESYSIINGNILASNWYPYVRGMLEPTKSICDMFYAGSMRGAEEIGRFSAEKSLRGIYRFYVKIASPDSLLKRATTIFQSYYNPCRIELVKEGEKSYVMKFSEFDPPSPFVEHRVMGWVEAALEICGASSIKTGVRKSAQSKNDMTELSINWK
ncbi:MAG: DUF2378 family protein [bacterium]|nr:DUF2378 family protein [bacterium]